MAVYANEPWKNPANNAVTGATNGSKVQPIMIIDPATGLPTTGSGGGGGSTDWDKIVGNSIEFTYYTSVVANNPSGNKNVATAIYKTGATTMFTQTFVYDATDDVLSITTA